MKMNDNVKDYESFKIIACSGIGVFILILLSVLGLKSLFEFYNVYVMFLSQDVMTIIIELML